VTFTRVPRSGKSQFEFAQVVELFLPCYIIQHEPRVASKLRYIRSFMRSIGPGRDLFAPFLAILAWALAAIGFWLMSSPSFEICEAFASVAGMSAFLIARVMSPESQLYASITRILLTVFCCVPAYFAYLLIRWCIFGRKRPLTVCGKLSGIFRL
jgi:hypothetical protein